MVIKVFSIERIDPDELIPAALAALAPIGKAVSCDAEFDDGRFGFGGIVRYF